MRARRGAAVIQGMNRDSDLIGIPVAGGVILALLAVFCAYFFIGAVVGTILLLAMVVLGVVLVVRVIKANELN
jgi:hypothetical protein